jgi:transcriptional regulator with XRE-family HTH domain
MARLNNAWDLYYKLAENQENEVNDAYDIFYKISTAIFKYREKENLTQKELAAKLGITQAMVSKLESGIYNYTVEQLCKIANKLEYKFEVTFQPQEACKLVAWNIEDGFSICDTESGTRAVA